MIQVRHEHPATGFAPDKAEVIIGRVEATGATVFVADNQLTPIQTGLSRTPSSWSPIWHRTRSSRASAWPTSTCWRPPLDALPSLETAELTLPLTDDAMLVISWIHDEGASVDVEYGPETTTVAVEAKSAVVAKAGSRRAEL